MTKGKERKPAAQSRAIEADDFDPPRLKALIAALSRLGVPDVARRHALLIHPLMLAVVADKQARGHDVGRDDHGAFYARPRKTTVGLERELRDLEAAARKAVASKLDPERWINAWAAMPTRTQSRLWKRLLKEVVARAFSYSAPGYGIVVPRPEDALPAIIAEHKSLSEVPGAKRRRRRRHEPSDEAIVAIRAAYRELTGRRGGRVKAPDGKLAGRLVRLGREVDQIFGTSLFVAKVDSRRLRLATTGHY
jgi:hypothetical protein